MDKNKSSAGIILAFVLLVGCAGVTSISEIEDRRERDLRVGNIPSSLHPEWIEADRCTKCHLTWSWEFGYYRPWDRYGFISDYYKTSPFGYQDPYGLDMPQSSFSRYYFSDWWDGSWLYEEVDVHAPMHFGGYDRVNDGSAKPEDFAGEVIVVDQSGKGDAVTIQEGVDAARPGATVFVKSGTYHESVRLAENIRLWGENAHTTVINPDFTDSAIIAANNCDISGFTLTGTGMNYKTYEFTSGIYALDCDSTLVIRGNIFDSNGVFGILVESSRIGGTPRGREQRYIKPEDALDNLAYTGYPNPRIIGNTFYVIGERAVYSIHAAPEIANNIFIGNVKTLGMTQHSRPFIHHNVFYRNNVTFNTNRSMPHVAYNIMYRNYWGQRIVEGARPCFHDNVTWDSPYYKEFGEDGSKIPYQPSPGTGEMQLDPKFVDPDDGDFRLADDSPLRSLPGEETYGLLIAPGIQQPPQIPCARSFAEEFNNRNQASDSIVSEIMKQNSLIRNLDVSYTIDYRSYMTVENNEYGDQESVHIGENPVSGVTYRVPVWTMNGEKRQKTYRSELFSHDRSAADSGTVVYDGEKIQVLSGRFKQYCRTPDDPYHIGDKAFRENVGGLYLDYDQYLHGAIGPGGTFYFGYLRIMGGKVRKNHEMVNGHDCMVIEYPHLGEDQIFAFYLDPEIGYRPRKLEHYFERELYRTIDGYRYREIDGIYLPVAVTITDYAVKKPHVGKVVGISTLKVDDISMNDME